MQHFDTDERGTTITKVPSPSTPAPASPSPTSSTPTSTISNISNNKISNSRNNNRITSNSNNCYGRNNENQNNSLLQQRESANRGARADARKSTARRRRRESVQSGRLALICFPVEWAFGHRPSAVRRSLVSRPTWRYRKPNAAPADAQSGAVSDVQLPFGSAALALAESRQYVVRKHIFPNFRVSEL